MENKPKNPNAFPYTDGQNVYHDGMTLRDYFATSAMQIHMTNAYSGNTNHIANTEYETIAEYSYAIADAMLKQRELTEKFTE